MCIFSFFLKDILFSAGRMRLVKTCAKIVLNSPQSWVHIWSNYVAQHAWSRYWPNLGPDIDSTFWTFGHLLVIFCCSLFAEATMYIVFSAQTSTFLSPPPKNRNNICEHDCTKWKIIFCYVFDLFLARHEEAKNEKNKKNKQKRTRQQDTNKQTI